MVKMTVIVTSCYKKGTETLKREEDRTWLIEAQLN